MTMLKLIQVSLATFAVALLSASATAQLTPPSPPTTNPLTGLPHLVVPATPFSWSPAMGTGPVTVPLPGKYGWFLVADDLIEARVVPTLSGDPTIEAIFYPPASGHPTRAERITMQFPLNPGPIQGSGALVIAFHSYSVSEKDIFVNTGLAEYCRRKGWTLIAPYGLIDTHYGNVASQESLDQILKTVGSFLPYDKKRVYTVGFSMGGGAAISYSMRHLSEDGVQIAGVVNHTGTQDLVDVYNSGSLGVKQLLKDANHFGAAPTNPDGAFNYKRVSPVTLLPGGAVNPASTPMRNLAHIPIYTFVNLNDPKSGLVQDNINVSSYLQSLGINVNLVARNAGFKHKWSTMPLEDAMDWISSRTLPDPPKSAAVFADLETHYFGTTVRAKPALRVAYYNFDADKLTNTLQVTGTNQLDVLALDLATLELNPALPVNLVWSTIEAAGDTLVLTAVPKAPSAMTMNGLPFTGWSHDRILGELTIVVPGTSSSASFTITP